MRKKLQTDIGAVMWRESKFLLLQRERRLQLTISLLVPLGLSIWLPWEAGATFVRGYLPSMLVSFVLPLMLVGTFVPDSFAGERERKTLETLLATRLPDRAIVLGKLVIAIVYGWSACILTLLIGLLVVNAVHWQGQVILYAPRVLFANLLLGLLMSILTASLGIVISMRARGVQEATQFLMMTLLIPPMIASFVALPLLGRPRGSLQALTGTSVVVCVLSALAVLGGVFTWMALRRFRRDRIGTD